MNRSDYLTGCYIASNEDAINTCAIKYGHSASYPQFTTGNITTIFDMSGGAWERRMANYNNLESNSGFSSMPSRKYYNLYTSTDFLKACNGKPCLGHANYETKNWYSDYFIFPTNINPWLDRSGYSKDLYGNAGLFHHVANNGSNSIEGGSFRLVI